MDIFTHWASSKHTHAHRRNEEEYAQKERGKSEVKVCQIEKRKVGKRLKENSLGKQAGIPL